MQFLKETFGSSKPNNKQKEEFFNLLVVDSNMEHDWVNFFYSFIFEKINPHYHYFILFYFKGKFIQRNSHQK